MCERIVPVLITSPVKTLFEIETESAACSLISLTLWAMNNRAISYDDAGRNQESLALREIVLARRKTLLGPDLSEDHPDTLRSIRNLAMTYHHLGVTPKR